MNYIMIMKEPHISLILTKNKDMIFTDKECPDVSTVSILSSGIDYKACEYYNLKPEQFKNTKGNIVAVMRLSKQQKTTNLEYNKRKYNHYQIDDFENKVVYQYNILNAKPIKLIPYVKQFGKPIKDKGMFYKTSQEYENYVMGRKISDCKYFKSPVSTVYKDKTSPLTLDCPFALALNTYMGCEHNCLYCFVKNTYGYNGMFTSDEDKIVRASIEDIKKQFYDGLYSTKNNVTANLIRKKMPIKIGISTDPLQKIDLKYRVTYNSLQLLNEEQYPFIMITKGDLAKRDEYAELIAKTPSIYFQTITTFDKDLMSRMEPNAPTLDDRIQSLQNINDKDKQANTQIRIEPMMLGININRDGSIDKEGFDELFRELKDIGVSGISTRYYCRNKIMDRQLKNEFGVDFQSEYEKTWLETLGYNEDYKSPDIPNDLIMLKTAKEFKELCDKYNFTYTPRMMKLSMFSNSKSDCCCSDRLKPEYKRIFDNGKSKISETEIYNICKEEGVVFFDDLKERGILKPDKEIEKLFNKELKRGNLYNNIDFKHILDMNGKVIGLEYIENKDDIRKYYKNIIETIRRDNHLKYKFKG